MSSSDTNNNNSESFRQEELEAKFEQRRIEAENKKRLEEEAVKNETPASDATILKPTDVIEEQDKGLFFDKKKYPLYSNEEYNRYLSFKRGERQKYIAEELSKKDKHLIPMYTNNGGPDNDDPFLDPEKPFTSQDAEHVKSVGVEQKEYAFHDASVKHFKVMQELDDKYAQAVQDVINAVQNAPKGGVSSEEYTRLANALRDAENKRYRFGARLFWWMTDDDYDRAVNLQNVKDIVDAAIHRTAHTIPNYTRR